MDQTSRHNDVVLENTLKRRFLCNVTLNKELLDSDLVAAKNTYKKAVGIKLKKDLRHLMQCITDLRERCKTKCNTSLTFKFNRTEIRTLEIPMIHFNASKRLNSIQISDYITTENGYKYISIDYKTILNALNFEVSYPDVIGDTADVEKELRHLNLITSYKSKILEELEWVQSDYTDSCRNCRISESEYCIGNNECNNYFLVPIKTDGSYKNVFDSNRVDLFGGILIMIDEIASKSKQEVGLIDIYDTTIVLKVKTNERTDKFIEALRSPVLARVLGRRFCFLPEITVIERD